MDARIIAAVVGAVALSRAVTPAAGAEALHAQASLLADLGP